MIGRPGNIKAPGRRKALRVLGGNIMGRLETTIFASVGGVRRCKDQAFFGGTKNPVRFCR